MDIAIAAYLIHPNNERYDYEALAREYLSMLVMSQTELLGKRSIKESFDMMMRTCLNLPALRHM